MRSNSYQFDSPLFRQLGYLTWLVLLIMSVVFYKERAIFLDGAFQLEQLINKGTFQIYHYRLTNPLTQILALAAIYLKLPLKIVMIAYSVNFILFFAGIYHAIVHWCKNDFLGWVQVFFFTLMVMDSYYFLPPELYQGSALMLLWWAILLKYPKLESNWVLLGLSLFMIPIMTDSRLIGSYFFFSFVFFWLTIKELRHWRYYLLLGFLFLVSMIHGQFFVSYYDVFKVAEFEKNLSEYFPNYLEIPSNQKFITKCLHYYQFYVIALLATIVGYAIAFAKKMESVQFPLLKIVLVIAANLGYLLILHLGSPHTTYRFYAEVNYLPLTIFVCIPLLIDILPIVKNQKWILSTFFITIVLRIFIIAQNHQQFEDRHQWYTDKMEEAKKIGTNKSIIHWQKSPKPLIIQPWASAQETLLLSSLKGPEFSKTLLVARTREKFEKVLKEKYYFISDEYNSYETKERLNSTYFSLGDETEYVILKK